MDMDQLASYKIYYRLPIAFFAENLLIKKNDFLLAVLFK